MQLSMPSVKNNMMAYCNSKSTEVPLALYLHFNKYNY